MTSTWAPWMKLAASEASQATVEATSSAVPTRPRGVRPTVLSRAPGVQLAIIGVSITPGLTQFTVIPCGPA